MKQLTTIFLALLLFGCDSQGNDDPNVSGTWSGVTSGLVVTMNLVEKDNGVTGTGKIGVVVITLLGTHNEWNQ